MTKSCLTFCAALFAGLCVAPALAVAQDPAAPVDPANPTPSEAATIGGPELTSVVLNPGQWSIRVPVAIGLNSGYAAKPISLPVDAYYGLSEALTIGVSHSFGVVQPIMRYWPGSGICVSSEMYCPKVYDNIGLDAIYRFMSGVIQVAGHGGFDLLSFDPGRLALRLGVLGQAPLATNIAIMADPRVWIFLTDRAATHEELWLPLAVQFWATPTVRLAARTNLGGRLDGFADYYFGALGVFGAFGLTDMFEVFAAFDFTNLYGKGGSADYRALVFGMNIGM